MSNQEDNDEKSEVKGKKCPLNSFKPCIGDDCAFFLATSSVSFSTTTDKEDWRHDANIFLLAGGEPTCAIRLTGFTSTMNYLGLMFTPTPKA